MKDYLNIARKIFEGTKYKASEEEVRKLANNMAILEGRGLGKLNQRLIKSGRGVWATIAEHNFAIILVSQHCSTIPISYEPDIGVQRPPDFKVEIGDVTYWLQIKDLSKLERENRQDKIIQQIKRDIKEIKVSKFFSCMLSNDFKEDCLPELINFIKDKAASASEGESFLFTAKNNQRAKIEFWSANNIELSELTLGYAGDLEMVEITGLVKEQIKQSLLNAVGAFNWEVDQKNINLIVMEADNKEDIDICDALFGTEYEIIKRNSHSWGRKNDGLFNESDFSKKVAGVIAIKRKQERIKKSEISQLSPEVADYINYLKKDCGWTDEKIRAALEEGKKPEPVADYYRVLYMNNRFNYLLEDIKKLLTFDKVVYYNMRPPMGEGNFRLS
jgi:hypothetical protein